MPPSLGSHLDPIVAPVDDEIGPHGDSKKIRFTTRVYHDVPKK